MKCVWCDKTIPDDSEICPECGLEVKESFGNHIDDQRRQIDCIRCGGRMKSLGQNKIQLGQHGLLLGDLSHLLNGALVVEIFKCKNCRKLEFFSLEE